MKKPQPESILSLSAVQQGLLLNSLRSNGLEGMLQVECTLNGPLEIARFEEAWIDTIARHEALRSSVHWENIKRPVQVVRKEFVTPFEFVDWSGHASPEFEDRYLTFKNNDAESPLDISGSPAMRFTVFKETSRKHRLLWTCHHILLDGWSSAIVLRDLIGRYTGTIQGGTASLKDHRTWLGTRPLEKAAAYWTQTLSRNKNASIFGAGDTSGQLGKLEFELENHSFAELSASARKSGITLSTLVHAAWALTVSSYFDADKVYVGTTVSGRSGNIPNIEKTAGLFSNVLPVSVDFKLEEPANEWMKRLQSEMAVSREFEFFGENEILELPGSPSRLFDSLVVIENIPFGDDANEELQISDYSSGLTSAYTATLAALPLDALKIKLLYRAKGISENSAKWLANECEAVLRSFAADINRPVGELRRLTGTPPVVAGDEVSIRRTRQKEPSRLEHDIRLIWEEVLGVGQIGLRDDFFNLGGRSLAAVRIFGLIRDRLGLDVSPVLLVEHSTVEAVAKALAADRVEEESWSTVVPLGGSGSKPPLFCLHAGGGHVLFYRSLVGHLDSDQPAFGVQAVGIEKMVQKPETIGDLADHYLQEIKKVQPEGPYSLLGYCFSGTVAIEIAKRLKANGETLGRIIVVDSPPMDLPVDVETMPGRLERIASYFRLIKAGNLQEIKYRIGYKFRSLGLKVDEMAMEGVDDHFVPELADLSEILSRAFKSYEWENFDLDLTLVMAGPIELRPFSKVIVAQWKSLNNGSLDVHYIEADHATILVEPDVKGLARVIQESLNSI